MFHIRCVPGLVMLSGTVVLTTIVAITFVSSFLRLRRIPGPWWAAFTRLWLVRTLALGDAATEFDNVNKAYGRRAYVKPFANEIGLSKCPNARLISVSHLAYS